jgi:protein required for attachment to host cells
MAKKTVTWIVVADGAHARVYAHDGPGKGLRAALEKDFETSLPHHVRDILTDRRGRYTGAPGSGRHAMDPRTDPKRHVAQEFVKSVAEVIGGAAQHGYFDRLILVAPPKTLGDLRAALPKLVEGLVTGTLDKDLIKRDDGDIERHLVDDGLLV